MTEKDGYLYTTCYICGCTGFNKYSKLIAKCSTCENLQHQYCMIDPLFKVPEGWRCDACQPNRGVKEVSKVEDCQAPGKQLEVHHKKFGCGKVKYIPLGEVALLESGAKVGRRRMPNACNQTRGGVFASQKPQWLRPKEEPFPGKLCCPKPPSKDLFPAKKIKPNALSFKQEVHGMDLAVVRKDVMVDSGGVLSASKKPQCFRPKEELFPGKLCCPMPPSKDLSPAKKIKPNAMSFKQEVHGMDLAVVPENVIVGSERSLSVLEAGQHLQMALWKGSFNIKYTNLSVCFGVEAHFWKKWMNEKAYEVYKKMPKTVQLKFKPCESIWPKIFKLQPPEFRDIALYFDPSEDSCSRNYYYSLLKKMEREDLGMGCCINSAYLLIFSSRMLSSTLQLDKNGLQYMWGVFCPSKLLSSRPLALVSA